MDPKSGKRLLGVVGETSCMRGRAIRGMKV